MRTVVFSYSLRAPTEGADEAHRQIVESVRFYNRLVRTERIRRYALLLLPKEARTKEVKECLDAEQARQIKEEYARAGKCDLTWHTRLITMAAFDAAKKDTLAWFDKKSLHFRTDEEWRDLPRWKREEPDANGALAVQIHSGMPADRIFACTDTRIQIEPLDPQAFDQALGRGARRRLQFSTVRVRIGSTDKRAPVWAAWPLYMHRPLPKGAILKWAKVLRRKWKQGQPYRWELQLTVEIPETIPAPGRAGMVAVNLGWRKLADGSLRAATWVGSDGRKGELRLDAVKYRSRVEKARSLQSIRAQHLDVLREALVAEGVPCSRWRSPNRFRRLEAEPGSTAARLLTEWDQQDWHLWWYERGVRHGALNWRREQYRLLAARLASEYEVIVVEDYDLRPIVTDEDRRPGPARCRVEASPFEGRQALRVAAGSRGALAVDAESEWATQACWICGYGAKLDESWDARPSIMHTCAGCAETWDQDENNCRNLLARAQAALAERGWLVKEKPKRPAKFAKRHKKATQATV